VSGTSGLTWFGVTVQPSSHLAAARKDYLPRGPSCRIGTLEALVDDEGRQCSRCQLAQNSLRYGRDLRIGSILLTRTIHMGKPTVE
jgi:hypothetical protein